MKFGSRFRALHSVSKQRPRVARMGGFSKAYTPKETANYENLVKFYYQEAAKSQIFPDDVMLDIRILAYYSIPKSVSKKKRAEMLERKIRPTKKPDIDNVCKCILDACNKVAFHDDSQVVDMQARKFYSEQPRVEVIIRAIRKEN